MQEDKSAAVSWTETKRVEMKEHFDFLIRRLSLLNERTEFVALSSCERQVPPHTTWTQHSRPYCHHEFILTRL